MKEKLDSSYYSSEAFAKAKNRRRRAAAKLAMKTRKLQDISRKNKRVWYALWFQKACVWFKKNKRRTSVCGSRKNKRVYGLLWYALCFVIIVYFIWC